MRHLAILLVVLAVLLPAVPARAGDDEDHVQRLERRVEMLIDLVAELRAEVLALRARVEELETVKGAGEARVVLVEEDERAVEEKVEVIPATPLVPAPIVVFPDVSGVYALDKEATVAVILAAQLEGAEDEEMAAMIREGIAAEFQEVAITLRMEANGTFFVRVETTEAEDEGTTARGTWTRDESVVAAHQRLVLLTTHEDGEEDPNPTELVGRWQDGRLTLREDDDDDGGYAMVFRRKTAPARDTSGD